MSPSERVTDLIPAADASPGAGRGPEGSASPHSESLLALRGDDIATLRAALNQAAHGSETAARLASAIAEIAEGHPDAVVMIGVAGNDRSALDVRRQLETLTEQMTPGLAMPSEAGALLSQRNARRRAELLMEFGALSGEQIAEERSRASNRHALAARWRKEGRIFGVNYRGQIIYPAFQFDDDENLRPVIGAALAKLPRDRMTEWEVAFWWTASNGWLAGQRPVDLLDDEPRAVVAAAERLAAPSPL